jgi:hypothetical protein
MMAKATSAETYLLEQQPNVHKQATGRTIVVPTKKSERDQPLSANDVLSELPKDDPLRELFFILSLIRQTDEAGELAMIQYIMAELKTQVELHETTYAWRDKYDKDQTGGNIHCKVLVDGSDNRMTFSSHIDTVSEQGAAVIQEMFIDPVRNEIFVGNKTDCLGADDGAGVWIMLNMIRNQVPGYYIFHRDEESGGRGSIWLAQEGEETWKKYNYMIAFDRMGYTDVITDQTGVTASWEFADALSKRLNAMDEMFIFEPSDRGLFTDSKNYAHLIPECTNLSVGYFQQHGSNEYLDYRFCKRLMEACCKMDWAGLPVEREPVDPHEYWDKYYESKYGTKNLWKEGNWRSASSLTPEDDSPPYGSAANTDAGERELEDYELTAAVDPETMIRFAERFPNIAGYILNQFNVTEGELIGLIGDYYDVNDTSALVLRILSEL